jgi:hypothetical protein
MTIDELIDELIRRRQMHGGETVVRTTWEGVARDIDLDNIYYVAGAQSRAMHSYAVALGTEAPLIGDVDMFRAGWHLHMPPPA